jgi:hypothetical protein
VTFEDDIMHKIAIVVLADISPVDGLGRIYNALMAVKEFKDSKDDVQLIFSGAGTKWLGEIANSKHQFHQAYQNVKDHIAGSCGFCATAFGVADSTKACGVDLLEDYGTNMSFRKLREQGYEVITF